jgi:ankyrin repeat protein
MAKFLLRKGADVSIQDSNGLTVLHIVARTDMVSLARELIKLGSDVNALDKYSGFTPLDYAQDEEPEMQELLEVNGGICTSC